jgi:hypothetical protein
MSQNTRYTELCQPRITDTVEAMRVFLQRTSDLEPYATVYIPELQLHSQPLIYARLEYGQQRHISNIVKRAFKDRHMGNMMTAHVRGASASNIVQLVPDLTKQALALGRWTTPHTFRNHYQAPVLGTWTPVPNSIKQQQVLRWGWTVHRRIKFLSRNTRSRRDTGWDKRYRYSAKLMPSTMHGDYMVNGCNFKHWELMQLISDKRSTVTV